MSQIPDDVFMHVPSLREAIHAGEFSAEEAVRDCLQRINGAERLNTFISVLDEQALDRARSIDERLSNDEQVGALAGVPIAVKDNMCVENVPTTAGSRMLEDYKPPYSATVVQKLRDEGAIIVGKTNMDEFAMGSSGENSAFEAARNPWDTDRVAGGSSSGSAAAVAGKLVPAALGSDTGGSIRQPAAMCGVTGCKPTYGRVSRYGLIAFASSLDQIGPITRDAEGTSLLLSVISGEDQRDATSAPVEMPEWTGNRDGLDDADGLRIGVPEEFFSEDGVNSEVRSRVLDGIGELESAGAELVDISLPHTEYGIPTYYLIATSEASSNLARYDGMHYGQRSTSDGGMIETFSESRELGFGEEVKRRIMLGTFSLSAGYYDQYYNRALKVRRLIKDDFEDAFESVDVIAGPTSPIPPFKLGEKVEDPLQLYLCDLLTVTCNLAGIPGISLPCGFTDQQLPVGLQLIGTPFDEPELLELAELFQERTDYHTREPDYTASSE